MVLFQGHEGSVKAILFLFVLHFGGGATQLEGTLVPQPGIEPMPSAVKAQHPNHWTTGEFLVSC